MDGKPACWDWAVTEDHRIQVAALAEDGFPEARELLTVWQDNRCALCGYRRDRLVMDHCHRTTLVRGLLCQGCNVREGKAGRNSDPRISGYRTQNPATMLGLQVIYHDLFGPVDPLVLLDRSSDETGDLIQAMFSGLATQRARVET
jgi:hypothetical protein